MNEPLLVVTHPACLQHDAGAAHPESPARLRAVLEAVESLALDHEIEMAEAPRASREALLRVHDSAYLDELERRFPEEGRVQLDPDTIVSAGSREAAERAAGAVEYAVAQVLAGAAKRAFCAVRPPGHHAEADRAMGFCLYNNVAVGAAAALADGLSRVAIVDFDVHHGNGTEAMFKNDKRLLYCSLFQHPLYPGCGLDPTGNDVFVPLAAGTDGAAYRAIFAERVEPALAGFRPELIFISAGFDAHAGDPLAGLALEDDDYAWLTERIVAAAEAHARGRVISVLEGGYHLAALRSATLAHLRALAASTPENGRTRPGHVPSSFQAL
ncbi:MAG TPA: histone deacetylase family protein [Gammaproteobacteria bacterium]|nr:histone deacetylase family protein [Gammaproteobacteria bacterium]